MATPDLTPNAMITSLDNMARALDNVRRYGRKSRIWLIIAIASVALDLALSAGLVYNNVSTCNLSNETRAKQVQLWDHVLALSPPSEKATEFRAFVHKTFTPRQCSVFFIH